MVAYCCEHCKKTQHEKYQNLVTAEITFKCLICSRLTCKNCNLGTRFYRICKPCHEKMDPVQKQEFKSFQQKSKIYSNISILLCIGTIISLFLTLSFAFTNSLLFMGIFILWILIDCYFLSLITQLLPTFLKKMQKQKPKKLPF
jgi:hypothetical protein